MADLRKEELFPADAFGLFYLQITRIPGGWHRHAEYEIFYHISGPIVFEVEGEFYPLRPPDVEHEFSQKTGTSVYRYLMQQWLHAVCELLEQGTVPNEAYLLCGFKDYANFYRAFRSAYGQSPREYARAHRKAAEEPASPDA